MPTEVTPLLSTPHSVYSDAVFERFSSTQKRMIVAIVSVCGVIPLFVIGTFTPSIPQIAKDLNTSGTVINLAVSLSALAACFGGLMGATYSTFYGQRPVYLTTLFVFAVGSFGVAAAKNVPSLLSWRFVQSLGASPALVLGASAIGNIYKLEERGRAMSVFFAACLLGPTLSPLAGGVATYYLSWRIMQAILGIFGLLIWCIIYFSLAETTHPGSTGVEKLWEEGNHLELRHLIVNPFRPIYLLRRPNLLAISFISSTCLVSAYVLGVPLAFTIGNRYNVSNDALVGACFLPAGLGNMVGAPIIGIIADRTVIHWRNKRQGNWYPEDRLRASIFPLSFLIPISFVAFGIINKYVDGPLGLSLSLLCLFINGIGTEMAFGPCVAYLVDIMRHRGAESLAANGTVRSMFITISAAVILPMIDTFGMVTTYTFWAVVAWLAYGLLRFTIANGERMRAGSTLD